MQKKTCYAAGTALAVSLAPLTLLVGSPLAGSQSAYAADPAESFTSTVSPAPTGSSPSSDLPSESPTVTDSPSATESPGPETSVPESPSSEPTDPEPTSPVPVAPTPSPEPSSSAPSTPVPVPSENPLPSANPEPAPSQSAIEILLPPGETADPDVAGGAAGLPSLPAPQPTGQPSAGIDQTDTSQGLIPVQGSPVPSTLGNSVAGAQAPGRMDADTSQLETSPVGGTVLGIFSSSQQDPGYSGAPEWVEGFLNAAATQEKSSSTIDPNQAAGVAGAETQGHQAGAVTGSSIFQRGSTIMNGSRPLLIFTGIATAGLALVVFNFMWRSRAPRN